MSDQSPPPTRRSLRADAPTTETAPVVLAPARALQWVDPQEVAARSTAAPALDSLRAPRQAVADLLHRPPRRSPARPGVLAPLGVVVAVVAVYCAITLLWPLYALTPTIVAAEIQTPAAAVTTLTTPDEGAVAVSVAGFDSAATTSADAESIASITKVVTALLVLDEEPLEVGEQGREFAFTSNDESEYWQYRWSGESALDVPVDGTLTLYQMLQGMLIGSANNYAQRLADTYWSSDAAFARAANAWLSERGITGITIANPSGIEPENTATPEALLALAETALANPVIAEIVATASVELPGAGLVENTNALLADPGVVGVKTGSLEGSSVLLAKDVDIDGTAVRIYAAVLNQADSDIRNRVARELFAQIEAELGAEPSVPAGTVVGVAETRWGSSAEIATTADAGAVLWNGASAEVTTDLAVEVGAETGSSAGTVTVAGPVSETTVDAVLASDIEPPSAWWRLTHPLELFGLL